ncbi:MAG: energy-coupling factor ABC transporter ATP-binding protein [Clostridiales bacterium]|nr:energy-coupling factor ABC transporter ATP-binding protein [Clostridiales bacterium]
MIEVENISYTYPKGAAPVLKDLWAVFKRGEIVAVSGKNGCGKTTLTKLLAGILRPDTGRILIDGRDTAKKDLFEIGQRIGYVFQNPDRQLFCETVYKEITFGLYNLGLKEEQIKQKANLYLDHFGLTGYREDHHADLSRGEKQRVALAAVLALGTDHLVLDEPAAALDMRGRRELGNTLLALKRDFDCCIVLVSHEADFMARYADRELVMPG